MNNYYEVLQIASTAPTMEIESAYEVQYNQWRRLVTHHDPNIVNQANQMLQRLEEARSILVDATQRAKYDESIGVPSLTGGLADTQARVAKGIAAAPPLVHIGTAA